ncbi:hypothetical protein F4778DRAFT_619991 [Xylariomycetidae sp. FL2044]|nr:hypothetical protein F4778DRAFT_619991 [Xylariomycetidae sp. FL2044]
MSKTIHQISSTHKHLKWSRHIPPVLSVPSGAELDFDLADGSGNQIDRANTAAGTAFKNLNFADVDPAVGPVYVEGAVAGDVLRVEILKLEETSDFGWTAIFPGFGLLQEDDDFKFDAAAEAADSHLEARRIKIWDLAGAREKGYVVFKDGIHVPYAPFLGLIGVAPAEGEHSTVPPLDTGGNLDSRYITEGSTLYLPVRVPGALLSLGDGHVAQGDGEVCGTAVEVRMRARIRVTVEKGKEKGWVKSPGVLTGKSQKRGPPAVETGNGKEYICLGIDSDIREATKKAVRGVMDWLEAEKGLTRIEAYMLCSVAGSLRMCEVVDMPNYAIGFAMPLDTFVS